MTVNRNEIQTWIKSDENNNKKPGWCDEVYLGAVIEKGISEKVIFKLGPSVRKEPASERRIGTRLGCLGNEGSQVYTGGQKGGRG